MIKANSCYDGCITVTVNEIDYDVDLTAYAYYRYTPGTMYRKNGDPGDPPEEELEIESINIEEVYFNNKRISDEEYAEIKAAIHEACRAYLENNSVYWEPIFE